MSKTGIIVLVALGAGALYLFTRPTPVSPGAPKGPSAGSPDIQNQLQQTGLSMLGGLGNNLGQFIGNYTSGGAEDAVSNSD